jgi:predicted AAA+ superfamily ATPase
MILRALGTVLRRAARRFPVITVTGPRQSGKTTLVKHEFPRHAYVSLEESDHRVFALEDPRGFLAQFPGPLVIDEAQRAPDLFSYLQTRVDERDVPGRYVLTGSQNFLLLQSVSQSLAGRCAILHLLPLTLAELGGRKPLDLNRLGSAVPRLSRPPKWSLEQVLFAGFYPRIHAKRLPPREWLSGYVQTYLERDVRQVVNIGDLETFSRFLRLCAGRNGQLINLSALAADCGISQPTARSWLSVLEASFLVVLLRPHFQNFNKRLTKSPRLYFLDTGLLCYLLNIPTAQELHYHGSRGSIFESYVVSEFFKFFLNRGEQAQVYFWRDSKGHEVDLLLDVPSRLVPVEIKSARTVAGDFFAGLDFWRTLSGNAEAPAILIHGGDRLAHQHNALVLPWWAL